MSSAKPYSVKAIKASFGEEKIQDEKHNQWINYVFIRPVSFHLAALLLNLNRTSNQIGVFSLIICLFLPFIALLPFVWAFIFLSVLTFILYLLDDVDGDMARASNQVSLKGHYLDFITDVFFRFSLYLTVALIFYNTTEGSEGISEMIFCLAGAWLTTAARLSRVYAKSLQKADREVYSRTEKKVYGLMDYVFFVVSSLDHIYPLFFLLVGFLGYGDILVGWIFIYALIDFIFTQISIAKGLS
ncbi:CDP-alcohol phosphatidyltransferase family protein [Terasakiella pusilla]|uniref:CDP-alcohol phosphatidyltransferase family protein n=1 Tax=Terasakiella pusilla TaxID=64973 RepID=UPI00048AA5FF|nr:CDP-alcohol phosphatidyltransferase family protein [Terasakiella pusilla]